MLHTDVIVRKKLNGNMSNTELSPQKSQKGLIYIIIGALIPVFPFYMFISYYQSLGLPFACSYFGWWSDCGIYATIWLISEAIGITLITKGLFLRRKK